MPKYIAYNAKACRCTHPISMHPAASPNNRGACNLQNCKCKRYVPMQPKKKS